MPEKLHYAFIEKEARLIIGDFFFAPATYRGSRRMYQKAYADAMALIREFGSPHLFITFTMDQDNKDLKEMLYQGQHSSCRPEIVAQVFNDRLYQFMDDLGLINPHRRDKETLANHSALGPVKAWFYSMEFQKGFGIFFPFFTSCDYIFYYSILNTQI